MSNRSVTIEDESQTIKNICARGNHSTQHVEIPRVRVFCEQLIPVLRTDRDEQNII